MTIGELARKLNITNPSVVLKLKQFSIFKGMEYNYSYEDYLIVYYDKYYSSKIRRRGIISKDEIKIVEYFLNVGNNTTSFIAKENKMSVNRVNYILNNYFKENCVIIESKMNNQKV